MSGRQALRRGCWGRNPTQPGRKALRSATPSRRAWGAVSSRLSKIEQGNTAKIEHYTTHLTSGTEDYLAEGETAARWLGSAAAAYGLSSELGEGQMTAMLNGVDPTRLGEVRDGIGAQDMPPVVASPLRLLAGWEFSIGPDKTFSALWAIADGETRDMLLAIHREACAAMVRVLDWAAYLRRGAGGKQWQHAPGVLCAAVTHTTSRTGDPQLHDHFLIANIAQAPDGKWLTLDGQLVYDMMQFAVTMYGRTLRHLATQRLGLTWTRPDDNGHRHITGVPAELVALWAERSKQIKDFMDDHPEISNDRASAITRPDKDERETYADKIKRWRDKALDVVPEFAQRVISGRFAPGRRGADTHWSERLIPQRRRRAVLGRAARAITKRVAAWDRVEALQTLAEIVPDNCPIQDIEALADELMASDLVVDLGIPAGGGLDTNRPCGNRYATAELLVLEDAISGFFAGGADRLVRRDADQALCRGWRFGDSGVALDAEQVAAACGIAGDGQAHVLSGPASTGKTYTLQAVARLARHHGVRIEAMAPSQAAADLLGEHVDVGGGNVQRRLDGRRGLAANGWWIVDEASMLPTHQLHQLTQRARERGAKLILVGDPHQLSVVKGAEGMFRTLTKDGRVAHHQLSEVRRFSTEWEQEASKQLRDGDEQVLDTYAEHDRIRGTSNLPVWEHDKRMAAIAAAAVERIEQGDDVAVTARSNDVAAALNTAIQRSLFPGRDTRALDVGDGRLEVGVGDRIITRINDFKIRSTSNTPIINGWAWTVKSIEDNGDLKLAAVGRGGNVILPVDYDAQQGSIQLGWASTVHIAQGRTTDVGITLVDGSTDLELLYVGATRGRHTNLIFGLGTDAEVLDTAKAATRKVRAKLSATEVEEITAHASGYPPRRHLSLGDRSPGGPRPSDPLQERPRPGRGPPAPDLPVDPLPQPAASPTRPSGPVQPPAPPRRSGPRLSELIDFEHPRDRRGNAEVEHSAKLTPDENPMDTRQQPQPGLSQPPQKPEHAAKPPRPAPKPAAPERAHEATEPEREPRTVEELARRAHHELGLTIDEITVALRNTRGDLRDSTTVGSLWKTLVIRHEAQTQRRDQPWFVTPEGREPEGPELSDL